MITGLQTVDIVITNRAWFGFAKCSPVIPLRGWNSFV